MKTSANDKKVTEKYGKNTVFFPGAAIAHRVFL